jgi:hypothetical protein
MAHAEEGGTFVMQGEIVAHIIHLDADQVNIFICSNRPQETE